MRKNLTTSIYTFKDMIEENCLYVDKTEDYFSLVQKPKGQFFLSRPRRFGKSLTLSALKSIFSGEKELFKGLYIYDQIYDWQKYPIIHLSMNALSSTTVEKYDSNLIVALKRVAKEQDISLHETVSPQMFAELIYELSKNNGKVVVLIDEYDKAILDNIENFEECEKIRTLLKQFFGQIKACEEYMRFSFITGVSKFTQVSVFSDLNNLTDISMDRKFATICGFTQNECEHYFDEWIVENAEELGMTKLAYLAKLKEYYNGIRFSKRNALVYNPVSFTKTMMNCEFENYWFETGTPSFLLKLLKKNEFDVSTLEGITVKSMVFSTYEIDDIEPLALLFQTGYLTIKDYDADRDIYTLSYPNREVESSFIDRLASFYSKMTMGKTSMVFEQLYNALWSGNNEEIIDALNIYYANIDYDLRIKDEKWYQTVFYLIFSNLRYRVTTEVKTNKGRMDAVVETPEHIYIFEFKLDKSADEAISQIKTREYYRKYQAEKRKLILLGVNFSSATGEIDDWTAETVETLLEKVSQPC